MDEEEMLKRKMLERRMQENAMQQMQQAQEQQQTEEMLKMIMLQVLDEKARERLAHLKIVRPQVALQLQMYLAQLYQGGQLKTRITDEQLVMILKKLTSRPETRIRRK